MAVLQLRLGERWKPTRRGPFVRFESVSVLNTLPLPLEHSPTLNPLYYVYNTKDNPPLGRRSEPIFPKNKRGTHSETVNAGKIPPRSFRRRINLPLPCLRLPYQAPQRQPAGNHSVEPLR